jgi:hypothetical protein
MEAPSGEKAARDASMKKETRSVTAEALDRVLKRELSKVTPLSDG